MERVTPPKRDDETLIRQAQAGDDGAFRELAQRYLPAVLRYAHARLGSRDDALDAGQDILRAMHESLSTFSFEAAVGAWIFGIARNKCIDLGRARAARKAHLARYAAWVESNARVTALPAETELALAETWQRVRDKIDRLDEPIRTWIAWRLQGDSARDIAARTGTPPSTVKDRLAVALRALLVDIKE